MSSLSCRWRSLASGVADCGSPIPPILPTTADVAPPPPPIRAGAAYRMDPVEPTLRERTSPEPHLARYDITSRQQALVLVLHGGKDRSSEAVTGRSLSWRRAVSLARVLGPSLHAEGVGWWVLRYRTFGWNG